MVRFVSWFAAAWAVGFLVPGAAHAARKVTGIVLDNANQPVSGLNVRVWDVDPGRNDNTLLGETTTDAQGRFDVRYRAHRDPGPFGTNPDLRVTVETAARYAIGNWFDQPGTAIFKTTTTTRDTGETTVLAWWPGFDREVPDWDPNRDITIAPGMLRVERNQWESVRTTFDPLLHGFNFGNPKRSICWGPTCRPPWGDLFRTKQTLCGGMSLTVLKKYVEGRCDTYTRYNEVSDDNDDGDRLPASLKQEIVTNQIETFVYDPYVNSGDLDSWLGELGRFPQPPPAFRFLEWQAKQEEPGQHPGPTIGAATKGQWPLIRDHLKSRELPAVLGLVHTRAAPLDIFDLDLVSGNHQVLAIGYDYSPYYRTATLYIYDPNYPGQIRELRFKEQLRHSLMYIDYDARKTRGFFLNVGAPPGVRAPARACPAPTRAQDIQIRRLEFRDAAAQDLAGPVAGQPLTVLAQVKNVGDDHISGQVEVACGVAGTSSDPTAMSSGRSSVQLKKRRRREDGGWSYSQDWVRVRLPAPSIAGTHTVACRATVASARGDVNPNDNSREERVSVAPAGTALGALVTSVKSPTWQQVAGRPFDRTVTLTVQNRGRFMADPESGGGVALHCGMPQMPWVSVIAMPGPGGAPEMRNAYGGIPDPNGAVDLPLLLHNVIKPPFPSPRQRPRDLVLNCTTYLGRFLQGPIIPDRPPAAPGGVILWKGGDVLRITNNESAN